DHAESIARFAIDLFTEIGSIQEMVEGPINLRVGIDSGPVIAGIIGRNKFSYDLWGDTVNIASRMESNGLAGKIQVSENTWNILKDKFTFTERGEIEIKGKGSMRSWILEP
ncbi:MAG TPA: adenylate/guanylate cyclase domain-containing protein, partial [Verrucomicrobiales bacterium]|nr:adenylate/guanylate cyclase domain-containing protein [Verrucomicrobiales bacterium]